MNRIESSLLEPIPFEACWETPPSEILRTISLADEMLAKRSKQDRARIPALVNSNYYIAYNALRQIAESGLATGRRFCEWGSGLGVVTCIASHLGFCASGIEIEESLCEFARQLAAKVNLSATFYAASYREVGQPTEIDAESLPFPIGSVMSDVVYVYPWPGEKAYLESLFAQSARPNALLVSYHGGKTLSVQRRSHLPVQLPQ